MSEKRGDSKGRGLWNGTDRKKFVVDGYSCFIFGNNNGQVYTQSCIYDTTQGITKRNMRGHERRSGSRVIFQKSVSIHCGIFPARRRVRVRST